MTNWNGLSVQEHRLYNIWCGMLHRCENPNREKFEDYGGRGITVCEEWHDFSVFVDWAKSHGYEDDLTIDRINVNGNYTPDNCRWATSKQQSNNKRTSVIVECNGIKATVKQWAELLDISPFTIHEWINAHGRDYAEERIKETVKNGGLKEQTRTKSCIKCGETFEYKAINPNSKYCNKCRKIAEKEKYERYRKKQRILRGAKMIGDSDD